MRILPFLTGATHHQPTLEPRQFKGCLPTAGTLLKPKIVEGTEDKLKESEIKNTITTEGLES